MIKDPDHLRPSFAPKINKNPYNKRVDKSPNVSFLNEPMMFEGVDTNLDLNGKLMTKKTK